MSLLHAREAEREADISGPYVFRRNPIIIEFALKLPVSTR
jgi:hypothetical protein